MTTSNQCDTGYHERCRDKECDCACHAKKKFEVGEVVYFAGVRLTVVAIEGHGLVRASSPTWGSVTTDASGFYKLPEAK